MFSDRPLGREAVGTMSSGPPKWTSLAVVSSPNCFRPIRRSGATAGAWQKMSETYLPAKRRVGDSAPPGGGSASKSAAKSRQCTCW